MKCRICPSRAPILAGKTDKGRDANLSSQKMSYGDRSRAPDLVERMFKQTSEGQISKDVLRGLRVERGGQTVLQFLGNKPGPCQRP